jgi:hypothetical protein
MADFVESTVRQWLRQWQLAYCPDCMIAGLQCESTDSSEVRSAVAALAKRPAFSVGHCLCGSMGVRYRSLSGAAMRARMPPGAMIPPRSRARPPNRRLTEQQLHGVGRRLSARTAGRDLLAGAPDCTRMLSAPASGSCRSYLMASSRPRPRAQLSHDVSGSVAPRGCGQVPCGVTRFRRSIPRHPRGCHPSHESPVTSSPSFLAWQCGVNHQFGR